MPHSNSSLDIEATLQRVQDELERRRAASASASVSTQQAEPAAAGSGASAAAVMEWLQRREFSLDELIAAHDSEFIAGAYRALLKRAPDYEGGRNFLGQLRSGQLSKAELLGRIRYSPEGRAQAVRVRGLLPVFAFQSVARWPVLGYPLRLASWLLRLPLLARNVVALDAHGHALEARLSEMSALTEARMDAQAEELTRVSAQLQVAQTALAEQLTSLQQTHVADIAALQRRIDLLQSESLQREAALRSEAAVLLKALGAIDPAQQQAQIESRFVQLQVKLEQPLVELQAALSNQRDDRRAVGVVLANLQTQTEMQAQQLQDVQAQLGQLQEAQQSAALGHDSKPSAVGTDDSLDPLDEFYVEFENRFRGSREDILQRARYYLPLVEACVAGSVPAPVLDLGCGRGEWLQLLGEAGHRAYGIDTNGTMVEHCHRHGLEALQVDALAHLSGLQAESIGAISAMHLIEHLDFRVLLALLDECLRVLRPGGLLLLETPNPENVHVGSCNFYMDPTHRNPLPPLLTQYLAESRGFVGTEIHRLSADRGEQRALPQLDVEQPGSSVLNQALADLHALTAAAPDYALIARKAG